MIDLRSTAELERNGRYPGHDVAFHHAPLFEEDTMPFKWAEPNDPEPTPGEDYIAIAATGASSLADALGVIAENEHPVIIHCAAGKDRTGTLTALLLSTLWVPVDTIAYDYELSNLSLAAHLAWAEVNDREEAAEIAGRPPWLLQSSGSVIKAFLKNLRSRYGSTDRYLTTALGVSPDVIENIRVRLLDQT